MKKLSLWLTIVSTFIIYIVAFAPVASASKRSSKNNKGSTIETQNLEIPQVSAITAQTAILADADTGQIYFQKDMHKQMFPASITKILTGLVAVKNGSPNDVITAPADIASQMPSGAAGIALQGGEQLTGDEAMYTMFLALRMIGYGYCG